jgi:hypothetical protein
LLGDDLPDAQTATMVLRVDTHQELLRRLGADLIAGRRTLPEAATALAEF